MPKQLTPKEIVISSSPYSETIPLLKSQMAVTDSSDVTKISEVPIEDYVISGSHTLTGAVSINPATDARKHMQLRFLYRATLVLDTANGKGFSVFGYRFLDSQGSKKAELIAYHNGSSWEVTYIPDFEENDVIVEKHYADDSIPEAAFKASSVPATALKGSIPGSKILNRSITESQLGEQSVGNSELKERDIPGNKLGMHTVGNTELGLMEPGTVKAGGNGWAPEDVQMNTPGAGSLLIAQGYGKRPEPKLIGHQGTITKDGLLYINPGAVANSNMGTYAISPDKADDTMVSELVSRDADFAVAGEYKIKMGFPGYVWGVTVYIDSTITGSNGLIEIKNDDDTVMTSFTINTGDTIGESYNNAVSANNAFDKFDTLKVQVSGASGGKVHLDFICVKRP